MEVNVEKIHQGILEGDREAVIASFHNAIESGVSAETILRDGMMSAMAETGRLFEEGEYFVPELLVSARAMQGGMELLKPLLVADDIEAVGKVVIGTVKGDLHDIGKNLVGIMLEGAGFDVIDLGSDVNTEDFVAAVKSNKADVIGLSALLTTTMSVMPTVINALEEAGIRNQVKVMVGGAPLTQEFADRIGADGYAPDASQAAKIAMGFVS